ncbi:o-succinylbenzoate--CoA ligase [Agarivorans sp. Z349TD_8]|uniref:o-succinylbenzoate--CoA ligase n=1 Tax=Agarivorans sp. Z349TD_8 TaxID=3421434 RepID=UPI003D7EBC58
MNCDPLQQHPLHQTCQQHPNRVALSIGEQHYSYQQLQAMVGVTAAQLRRQGLSRGDRLSCFGDDQLRMLLLQLASLELGYIFCPLNHHHPVSQLQSLSERIDAKFYWTDSQATLSGRQRVEFNPQQRDLKAISPDQIQASQAISIVFTSGSSGPAKAVVHSWTNHYFSALGSHSMLPLVPQSQWLLSLPLYHIGGQAIVWRCLLAGAGIVVAQNKGQLYADLVSSATSHVSLVPTQLYRLLQRPDFNAANLQLSTLLIGGAACNDRLIDAALERGFQVYSSYGSSEMSSQVATRNHRLGQRGYQLLPYRQAKIEAQQILLRGETLFLGYWQNGRICPVVDQEGWFNSGDHGRMQQDNLYPLGRSNHMFICAGENIQPEEIEQALLQHPQIRQAIVVAQDSAEYGQRPVAFIAGPNGLTSHRLNQFLRRQLAAIKLPIAYYALPETNSLKPSRSELTKIANHKSSCCDQC